MLDLGELTEGGSTPSARMAEVKTKEISPAVDIILPIETPKTCESKRLTRTIIGSFKSVKDVLKFLANLLVYNSSISIVSKSRRLAISDGSPRTSLTPIGSNEPSMSPPLGWRWRFQCNERRKVLQPS